RRGGRLRRRACGRRALRCAPGECRGTGDPVSGWFAGDPGGRTVPRAVRRRAGSLIPATGASGMAVGSVLVGLGLANGQGLGDQIVDGVEQGVVRATLRRLADGQSEAEGVLV